MLQKIFISNKLLFFYSFKRDIDIIAQRLLILSQIIQFHGEKCFTAALKKV